MSADFLEKHADILQMITDNLHITYTLDESTEHRLINEVMDGIGYIRKYIDPSASCEPGTEYAALLCEYVLRAESGALETFEKDFAKDIRTGKMITDVDGYARGMGYDETGF